MDPSRSSRGRSYLVVAAVLLVGCAITAAAVLVLFRLIENLH